MGTLALTGFVRPRQVTGPASPRPVLVSRGKRDVGGYGGGGLVARGLGDFVVERARRKGVGGGRGGPPGGRLRGRGGPADVSSRLPGPDRGGAGRRRGGHEGEGATARWDPGGCRRRDWGRQRQGGALGLDSRAAEAAPLARSAVRGGHRPKPPEACWLPTYLPYTPDRGPPPTPTWGVHEHRRPNVREAGDWRGPACGGGCNSSFSSAELVAVCR